MIPVSENYDVVVVGAGPAGSMAARTVAQAGRSVLLVEKRQEIGSPVRCAEGVPREWLERFVKVDPRWVCNQVDVFRLHAPDGTPVSIRLEDPSYVLERKVFDRDLAHQAAQAGARVLAKTAARGLVCEGRGKAVVGVRLSVLGEREVTVGAKVVIGADGVESQVGRWAGINTLPRARDMSSAVQYLMAGLDVDEGVCDFYLGSAAARGGYLWVFPKGNGMANVGLGVVSNRMDKTTTVQALLDRFVAQKFPTASILAVVVGGIPLSGTLKKIVKDGLMLVGDAAHQVLPHTGGGIHTAMEAGVLAGEVAVQSVEANDHRGRFLSRYAAAWNQKFGKEMAWSYRVKELGLSLDDETLNRIAALLTQFDPQTVTKKQLLTVLKDDPGLLLKLRHLL